MSSQKVAKLKVLSKYVAVIKEYFELMNQSTVIKGLANPNNNLFIGLNVVHRVFEYILIKTNSTEIAYFYSQKGSYYYLEYLEQINKSEFANAFSHMDAIMVVYRKTIFDIYDGENSPGSNTSTISNLLSLNTEHINIPKKELNSIFNMIFKFTRTLLFLDNNDLTFQNRIEINNRFLYRYLTHIDHMEFIISYLELIQEKVTVNYDKYNDILTEFIIRIEKMKKKSDLHFNENDFLFNKIHFESQISHENNAKELVKCLFV
jgi:hypothetical protein